MNPEPTQPKLSFLRRHPRRAKLMLAGFSLLAAFLLVEMVLRLMGFEAGYRHTGMAQFVPLAEGETLQVTREFYTDGTGLFRAEPDSFNGKPGYHVNRDGFRTAEFSEIDSSKPKIMLIGDSFLWGATADPIDSAFADRIARAGYSTINLGIPGTDPDQYIRVAERYIPALRPEAVCVFFYMGNDVIPLLHKLEPWQNRYHITTNRGWLNPYIDHVASIGGPDSTFAWHEKRFRIPSQTLWNRFCAKTAAFTLLWQAQARYTHMLHHEWLPEVNDSVQAYYRAVQADSGAVSNACLRGIQAVCDSAGIPLMVFCIPLHTELGADIGKAYPRLRQGLDWHMPTGLVRSDYLEWPNGHFNNSGHRKYADFVLGVLAHKLLPSP